MTLLTLGGDEKSVIAGAFSVSDGALSGNGGALTVIDGALSGSDDAFNAMHGAFDAGGGAFCGNGQKESRPKAAFPVVQAACSGDYGVAGGSGLRGPL
ncbi:hypothetical protein DT603_10990 [Pseudoxanthomonas gei]|uniref:Uncharacterized protein n=1 Tax=Pseudoxanthomonas gei TaxID=1383030 RepID=A0ABX0AFI7_9GAMM|nr:hypothetical protein [Pseudoxanthomonas gei]NDK39367.1 hypothetical protein [Pseudoxanthomonas gei]